MERQKRRFEKFKHHIGDKSVLHLGCVGQNISPEGSDWMHKLLHDEASTLVGLDLLVDEIETLRERGYAVEQGDATDFDFDRDFDVIFAGELIEHLSNFGGLLQSVKQNLTSRGKLIITTPNAQAVYYSLQWIFRKKPPNKYHTCWFDESTLAHLLSRFGFEPVEVQYAAVTPFPSTPQQLIAYSLEHGLPDSIGCRTLIVVAEHTD